jgi:hypothetical protein
MQHSIPQGPKATYIVHVQVCKYAGNPLTSGETTIYRYTSNTSEAFFGWAERQMAATATSTGLGFVDRYDSKV